MRLRLIVATIVAFALGAACQSKVASLTRQAFEERDYRDVAAINAMDCESHPPNLIITDKKACEDGMADTRAALRDPRSKVIKWENFQKEISRYVKTQNVTMIQLDKTIDEGNWVVTIVDPDYHRTSFWLTSGSDKGGLVRSISPY